MKRKVKPEDIYSILLADDPQISPCGKEIAYGLTKLDEQTQKYMSSIFVIDAKTKESKFTIENLGSSLNPSWNFDGTKLAFVSDKGGDKQVWVYDKKWGHAYQLTTMKYGVRDVQWSPIKECIYFLSDGETNDKEADLIKPLSESEKKQREKDEKEKPWHIKDIVYHFDGIGRLTDKKSHIWEVDINKAIPRKLTKGQHNYRDFSISKDGKAITYISDPIEDLEFRPQDINLWMTDLENDETKLLINNKILISKPTFSENKDKIVFIGHEAELGWGTIDRFYVYEIAANKYTCITKDYDNSIGNTALSDLRGGSAYRKLYWNYATEDIYFQTSNKGNNNIYKVNLKGNVQLVLEGNRNIYSFSIDNNFKSIAFCYTTPVLPNDVALYSLETKEETRITEVNKDYLDQVEISSPEDTMIKGHNDWNIQGWILKPYDFDASKKYPLILEIHGGPQMMYSNSFMLEFQLLCAKGYVVYYSNPRGSTGYGQGFMAGIQRSNGGVGEGDYKDLMAGVDYVESLGYIDTTKTGVTGGSYGGFMTNWVVGHTDRFKAAVTQRSISNWHSFEGVSDYGYCDAELAHQTNYFEELDELLRISPITYVKNVKTPLLILHSEKDLRCPLEQAQQLFINLKLLRKEVELVVFPDSSHGLSRNGKPYLRVERLNYIVNWFEKYFAMKM